jgi:hypothetical protein
MVLLGSLLPQAGIAQTVPSHIRAAIPDARMSGSGSYRWFGLKIYDAELWTSKEGVTPENLASTTYALDLRYARHLVGHKIADASIDEISKLGIGTPAKQQAWLASMTALFPDVEKDSRITGLHVPGQATRFYLNGAPLGVIADPEFGPAFFAIWLHPKTSEPALRRALLGLR